MIFCPNCGTFTPAIKAILDDQGKDLNYCPHCGCQLKPVTTPEFTDQDEIESLKRELAQHRKNLRALEELKARFGMDVPLPTLNQIDNAKAAIHRIEEQLRGIQ